MIALIDIDIGNVNSVAKALKYLDIDYIVVTSPDELIGCDKYIFPGVGSFAVASRKLETSGLKLALKNAVLLEKKPFLGICLGMQLIAKSGEEGVRSEGLGFIDAEIHRIPDHLDFKVPHVGWNSVGHDCSGIFENVPLNSDFYFVHSYRMILKDKSLKCFYTEHGEKIIAYIEFENIYGTQFHPEKSQSEGLELLRNFSELC